ncbi:hypothetical protein Pmani_020969 [Petrolisthes manimaculis]|uniref:Transposon Ty3-I Gag-Pol polyprotein n=1 Tax=Petrolisthes manimaculis TaxID=1843537 RepID=A0AAE1PGJ5_9EUCA|nr:hypothetical protein Pmani_020969 [Petrolisthes manimaculis]
MEFDLNEFLESPSLATLTVSRIKKADWIDLATKYNVPYKSSYSKAEIKKSVVTKLILGKTLPPEAHRLIHDGEGDSALIALKKLEIEEAERQREEAARQREHELIQIEEAARQREHEVEVLNLKIEESQREKHGRGLKTLTDFGSSLKFLPKFDEEDVETFFIMFERVATQLDWPVEQWSFFAQAAFEGKARLLYSSLSDENLDYPNVKRVILEAYDQVPETYRQKFRNYQKGERETYVEFVKEKERYFKAWLRASKIDGSYDKLYQLIILEEVLRRVPQTLRLYLREREVTDVNKAATLAENFRLTHGNAYSNSHYSNRQAAKGTKGASTIFWRTDGSRGGGGGAKPGGNGTVSNSQQSATGSTGRSDYKPPTNTKSSVVCAYCKSPDHHIRDCPKLKGKEKRPGHALATSTMSSTVPTSEPASCKPSTSQASSSFVMSVGQKETQDTNSAGCKPLSYSVDQFQPFRSRGMVSSSDSSLSHPIQILRDTGASHSLMLKGLVPDLDHCYLPQSVLIQGVGGCISVPLAKVYLDTDLAKDHNSPEASLSTPEDLSDIPIDSDTLKEAQIQDLELAPFFDKTVEDTDVMNFPICFYVKGGILMRKFRSHKFKNRLRTAIEHAITNLKSAQCKMKEHFDLKSVTREFKPGDLVLAFLPIHKRPLQSRYHGPYVVEKKINEVNYVIKTPDRRKSERLIHINLLKAYYPRDNDIVSPVINLDLSNTSENNDQDHLFPSTEIKMQNSELFANPRSKFQHMTPQQEEDMECLLNEFPQLFGDVPLQCPLVKHDVVLVEGARPVKQSPYRTSPWKREALRKEVAFLLDHGLAERSTSEWASPCVLVDKPDGSFRMCTDYRQVNSLTRQDCYPLPRIDDLIDQLGGAKIISKIDLLRGYYQYQLGPPRINTSSVCLVE